MNITLRLRQLERQADKQKGVALLLPCSDGCRVSLDGKELLFSSIEDAEKHLHSRVDVFIVVDV